MYWIVVEWTTVAWTEYTHTQTHKQMINKLVFLVSNWIDFFFSTRNRSIYRSIDRHHHHHHFCSSRLIFCFVFSVEWLVVVIIDSIHKHRYHNHLMMFHACQLIIVVIYHIFFRYKYRQDNWSIRWWFFNNNNNNNLAEWKKWWPNI